MVQQSGPVLPPRHLPSVVWFGSAIPLAVIWVGLFVTHALSYGALIAIGIAIAILAVFAYVRATVRLRYHRRKAERAQH